MRHFLKKIFNKEDGNIIIIFAFSIVVLTGFIGLAVDLGMIYMKRNELENLCQMVKADKLDNADMIRYADNPGATSYNVLSENLSRNNFNGTLTLYFQEYESADNSRKIRTKAVLETRQDCYFLRLFGIRDVGLHADTSGEEVYGDSRNEGISRIWRPAANATTYNGSYKGSAPGSYTFVPGDKPSKW